MVAVFPEAPISESGLEIDVRGANEAGVYRLGPGAAQAPDRPRLYSSEELGLDGFGQEADLVQKKRAPVRGLKQARLGPVGVREGSPLEAEQLGFQQRLRDRRAVDVHEGAALPGPHAMDEPGHEPLAGAGFALDEHRREAPTSRLALQQLAQLLPDEVDGRALTEQLSQLVHAALNLLVCSCHCSDF